MNLIYPFAFDRISEAIPQSVQQYGRRLVSFAFQSPMQFAITTITSVAMAIATAAALRWTKTQVFQAKKLIFNGTSWSYKIAICKILYRIPSQDWAVFVTQTIQCIQYFECSNVAHPSSDNEGVVIGLVQQMAQLNKEEWKEFVLLRQIMHKPDDPNFWKVTGNIVIQTILNDKVHEKISLIRSLHRLLSIDKNLCPKRVLDSLLHIPKKDLDTLSIWMMVLHQDKSIRVDSFYVYKLIEFLPTSKNELVTTNLGQFFLNVSHLLSFSNLEKSTKDMYQIAHKLELFSITEQNSAIECMRILTNILLKFSCDDIYDFLQILNEIKEPSRILFTRCVARLLDTDQRLSNQFGILQDLLDVNVKVGVEQLDDLSFQVRYLRCTLHPENPFESNYVRNIIRCVHSIEDVKKQKALVKCYSSIISNETEACEPRYIILEHLTTILNTDQFRMDQIPLIILILRGLGTATQVEILEQITHLSPKERVACFNKLSELPLKAPENSATAKKKALILKEIANLTKGKSSTQVAPKARPE